MCEVCVGRCVLIGVDEWGQVVIISMLTRYARTQFLDPNKAVSMGVGCVRCVLVGVCSWM